MNLRFLENGENTPRDISLILLDMWSKRKDASRKKLYDLHPSNGLRDVVQTMLGTENVKLNRYANYLIICADLLLAVCRFAVCFRFNARNCYFTNTA